MAFVFKTERPALGHTKDNFPGPGAYVASEKLPEEENYVPFLVSEQRKFQKKVEPSKVPGPGAYPLPVSIQGYNSSTKKFYSSLNPAVEDPEEKKPSTNFKSVVKRFENVQREDDAPGPGYYNPISSTLGKKSFNVNPNVPIMVNNHHRDEVNGVLKAAVPSIPSVVHAYGYTEKQGRALMLNNNPLLEIQKFVGPGYYDVPSANNYKNSKGSAWHKSGVPKTINLGMQTGTSNTKVGPGSYKIRSKGVFPLYKLKPSFGFASTTLRSSATKPKAKKKKSNQPEMLQDQEAEEDEGTPGPGYYHNTIKSSSFVTTQKPFKQQFFGSGSERFNDFREDRDMGPGKYALRKDFGQTYDTDTTEKAPFIYTEKRFEQKLEDAPGPGQYYKSGLEDDDGIKGKKAPKEELESFGSTEARFKSKVQPGPSIGEYYPDENSDKKDKNSKHNSYMFSSGTKREPIKATNLDIPPPGAYTVSNFDVSANISRLDSDDLDLVPYKPPFNSGVERFKTKVVQIDEDTNGEGDEDPFENGWGQSGQTRGDLINQARNQPKVSSVFSSETKRVGIPINTKEQSLVPGPGKYFNKDIDDWNKKTYNVQFTSD